MLAQAVENSVADLHVQRHLRGVLDHQRFDLAECRVRCRDAGVVNDRIERIELGLHAAGFEEVWRVVFVLVDRAGQQGHGADAEFAQLPAGGQARAHGAKVDVPGARQRLAPQQRLVQVDHGAAAALENGVDQVLRLRLEGGCPLGNAQHVFLSLSRCSRRTW